MTSSNHETLGSGGQPPIRGLVQVTPDLEAAAMRVWNMARSSGQDRPRQLLPGAEFPFPDLAYLSRALEDKGGWQAAAEAVVYLLRYRALQGWDLLHALHWELAWVLRQVPAWGPFLASRAQEELIRPVAEALRASLGTEGIRLFTDGLEGAPVTWTLDLEEWFAWGSEQLMVSVAAIVVERAEPPRTLTLPALPGIVGNVSLVRMHGVREIDAGAFNGRVVVSDLPDLRCIRNLGPRAQLESGRCPRLRTVEGGASWEKRWRNRRRITLDLPEGLWIPCLAETSEP